MGCQMLCTRGESKKEEGILIFEIDPPGHRTAHAFAARSTLARTGARYGRARSNPHTAHKMTATTFFMIGSQ